MLNIMFYRKFLGRDRNAASQTKPRIDNFTRFFKGRHNINHHFLEEERGSDGWRERLSTGRPATYRLHVVTSLSVKTTSHHGIWEMSLSHFSAFAIVLFSHFLLYYIKT